MFAWLHKLKSRSLRPRGASLLDEFLKDFDNGSIWSDFICQHPDASLIDAEVQDMFLDREFGFDFTGPTLRMRVALFDTYEPTTRRWWSLLLEFTKIELKHIRNFNHQNAAEEFYAERYYCSRLKEHRICVYFDSFGAEVEFTCSTGRVLSLEEYSPVDYFEQFAEPQKD